MRTEDQQDMAPVVFASLTDAYWLADDNTDCGGCRELLGAGDSGSRDGRPAARDSKRPGRMEGARMILVAVAALTVVAALVMVAS
ncbi:hypothetical protein [Streptomyces sp. NPDC127119]|uniref:hypothetical protein n=1 Tax=Streptomyces sp. NPDC127119 TaxID=3345370 RepID=UPI003635EE7D